MRRVDLEHLLRAASQIADDDEIIVLGSQAILGQFADAPTSGDATKIACSGALCFAMDSHSPG